jgi:hypothetical protein
MRRIYWLNLINALFLIQCFPPQPKANLLDLAAEGPSITGNTDYLNSPYVTAGDRLYMVGHQNGQFPDLGWHVEGEMGGIWDHPIKLMDGFSASLRQDDTAICLEEAIEFTNFPFANVHRYAPIFDGIAVERFQFVPDRKESVVVEYVFHNTLKKNKTSHLISTLR